MVKIKLLLKCLFLLLPTVGASFDNFKLKESPQKVQNTYTDRVLGLTPNLVDWNPLYGRILSELSNQYEAIGRRQAELLQSDGGNLYVGGPNNVGYRWAKDFADFTIAVRRQLAPDLFDENQYIVSDEFIINIDAQKVLHNLSDMGMIDITQQQYAAFAGITFRRVYRYTHFSETYDEGLVIDLDKLFLAFTKLHARAYLQLSEYEMIEKEDSISATAGGLINVPVYQGLSASAGILGEYKKLNKIVVQAVGPEDKPAPGEKFRVSTEKSRSVFVGATASLQLDFLKLLRITLLSYDLEYTNVDKYKSNLSFGVNDMEDLSGDGPKAKGMEKLMLGAPIDPEVFGHNIVSHERRKTENIRSKYAVLLLAGERESETSFIEIEKDGQLTTFFKHYWQKLKVKKDLYSQLTSIFFKSVLGLRSFVKKNDLDEKTFTMEYNDKRNLIKSKEDLDISKENKLTLDFTQRFYVKNMSRRYRRTLDNMGQSLQNFDSFDAAAMNAFKQGRTGTNLNLISKFQMGPKAINHFNKLDHNTIYAQVKKLCKYRSGKSYFNRFFSFLDNCERKLNKSFRDYYSELGHHNVDAKTMKLCSRKRLPFYYSRRKKRKIAQRCRELLSAKSQQEKERRLPLWRLRTFLEKTHEYSNHRDNMYAFFGHDNVFNYGTFSGRTPAGKSFWVNLRQGKFTGLGLVDRFMRAEQVRSPASVK